LDVNSTISTSLVAVIVSTGLVVLERVLDAERSLVVSSSLNSFSSPLASDSAPDSYAETNETAENKVDSKKKR